MAVILTKYHVIKFFHKYKNSGESERLNRHLFVSFLFSYIKTNTGPQINTMWPP